jgi:cell wall-associated NlpC family hydrolase
MCVRDEIVAAARWGIRNEPRIHYGEVRPMPLTRRLPLTTDCSGFVTLCYYLGGADDPNRLDYDGHGWTGTLLRGMTHVPADAVDAGDLVVFGRYPGRHVALVLEPGEDPLLCSHGQERGPFAIPFSEECLVQPPTVTWLSSLP